MLRASNCKRTLEILLRFRSVRLRRLQCDFTGDAIGLGLEPSFLRGFDCADRFANAALRVVELAEVRICSRQKG